VTGVASLGVAFVVGILVDQVLDWLMRAAGYDPEGQIAARVTVNLKEFSQLITEGDPQHRANVKGLPVGEIQLGNSSCRLHGLRGELRRIHLLRAIARSVALARLGIIAELHPAPAPGLAQGRPPDRIPTMKGAAA